MKYSSYGTATKNNKRGGADGSAELYYLLKKEFLIQPVGRIIGR
jgi:hypothetical protein